MRLSLPTWTPERRSLPQHVGLAYDIWAPVGPDGKITVDAREKGWLDDVANLPVTEHYRHAYARWKESFETDASLFEIETASRLLVGHGHPSATEVGITVHQTWGVPVIPGSALKGLTANYVATVYGPQGDGPTEEERSGFRGVTWTGNRIKSGPGEVYRALFGAPASDIGTSETGAAAGGVIFHDAWLAAVGDASSSWQTPFAVDVLTPHQDGYYKGKCLPNDYDDPVPVRFLTVRPKIRFLLALSGGSAETALAQHFLLEALQEWGIGAKTSSGYGRASSNWTVLKREGKILRSFRGWLEAPTGERLKFEEGASKPTRRSQLLEIEATWLDRLSSLGRDERETAAHLIVKKFATDNVAKLAAEIARRLRQS